MTTLNQLLVEGFAAEIGIGVPQDVANMKAATRLYDRARRGLLLRRIANALRDEADHLLALHTADPATGNRHEVGIITVALTDIRGSENRTLDFDRRWRPLNPDLRGRWIAVAAAWLGGFPMPPVELVQVGDDYYVRDGHHRVSVAHALGMEQIEASVTVWVAPAAAVAAPACALNPAEAGLLAV